MYSDFMFYLVGTPIDSPCSSTGDDIADEFCCSPDNPCDEGEGDCNKNSDCSGRLECGTNNCDSVNPQCILRPTGEGSFIQHCPQDCCRKP